jgi:hypothetical protein
LLAALLVVVMLTIGPGFALLMALLDFTENSLSLVFPLIGVLAPVSAVAATLRILWMIPLLVCGALLLCR